MGLNRRDVGSLDNRNNLKLLGNSHQYSSKTKTTFW